MEHWRYAPGYEGYQVSNEGNVKSLVRDIVKCRGGIYHLEEKMLKPYVNENGYLRVGLYKDGKRKQKQIHRLVAEAFIPNPHGYTEINHKDEDKTNNRVWINDDGTVDLEKSNLEWCDRSYNNNYGTRTERTSKKIYQYTLNGELVKIWPSISECGRNEFNKGIISLCCNNKYLREGNNIYKGYRWTYNPQ